MERASAHCRGGVGQMFCIGSRISQFFKALARRFGFLRGPVLCGLKCGAYTF